MGKKGETRTNEAADAAAVVVGSLAPLGAVTSRGMFGGYGVFLDGVMFGLVDRSGAFHLRVNDDTRGKFEEAGGVAHGRMPYFSVPDTVSSEPTTLLAWSEEAAAVALAAKK